MCKDTKQQQSDMVGKADVNYFFVVSFDIPYHSVMVPGLSSNLQA